MELKAVKVTRKKDNSKAQYYDITFVGQTHRHYTDENQMKKTIKKRQVAFSMVPDNARIVPEAFISEFNGHLMGGILEDSLRKVYGICNNGIPGFSCSIFWIPTLSELEEIIAVGHDSDHTVSKNDFTNDNTVEEAFQEDDAVAFRYKSDGLTVSNWDDDHGWKKGDVLDGCLIQKVIQDDGDDMAVLFMEVGSNGWQYVTATGKHLESSGAWFENIDEATSDYETCLS